MPLSYSEVQVAVYKALLERHTDDPAFTFSVRRGGFRDEVNKGLFIGTKTSGYFAFTLWGIPVNDPSANGDLLDYCVGWNRDGSLRTYLHYQLATTASGDQNLGNLAFGEALRNQPIAWDSSGPTAAVLRLTHTSEDNLTTVADVVEALLDLIDSTAALVDAAITVNHATHLGWVAGRLSLADFTSNRARMETLRANWLNGTIGTGKTVAVNPPTEERIFPLNQILYGPPGTGKTYHTVARAVALLEGISDEELAAQYPKTERTRLRQKFEQYQAAGRIAFVTFHQAFSYEDFVEGIKPVPPATEATEVADNTTLATDTTSTTEEKPQGLQYVVRKGIFRQMCDTAASYAAGSQTRQIVSSATFDELYSNFLTHLADLQQNTQGPVLLATKSRSEVELLHVDKTAERLTFGYPKGRADEGPYHVDKPRIQQLHQLYPTVDLIDNLKRDIIDKVGGSHQTLLWVVFNALKKYESSQLTQLDEDFAEPVTPFVLIIDEINRGNVANIFGELITLLEDDKRAGSPEALTVRLPYSQEEFSVPKNLYLLGTMNTADRSVEALDTALRRRFSFTEMLPQPHLLPDDVEGVNLQELLRAINTRLEQLLDHDHCIGHALLMRVSTLDDLREAFRRNILPLLQEYFFGDWGKIGLVIGSPFIQQVNKNQPAGSYKLLSFGSFSTKELSEKPVYRLTNTQQLDAQAFKSIYASS